MGHLASQACAICVAESKIWSFALKIYLVPSKASWILIDSKWTKAAFDVKVAALNSLSKTCIKARVELKPQSLVSFLQPPTISPFPAFIAFSTLPQLAEKVKMFFGLAPVATIKFSSSPLVKLGLFPELLLKVGLLTKPLPSFACGQITARCLKYLGICFSYSACTWRNVWTGPGTKA